ncbi:MAG: flagellar protein FliS [Clostridiales bacterium]|nr:flagellar protein FliS [Clostridiales bacterium]
MNYLKENYVERIKNASPIQLILITFELTIVNLEDAKQSTDDSEKFESHIRKSQEFLMQLMSSLDMGYKISSHLLSIYLYVNKLLHEAYFSKDIKNIDDCIEMLKSLLSSFEFAERAEVSDNYTLGSNIHAGYTYKNGAIEELFFEPPNSGFKA